MLVVFAEAFVRDRNPDDFSLEAILAHERGHQLLHRHPVLRRLLGGKMTGATEEVVASLAGSLLCRTAGDRNNLFLKAVVDAARTGLDWTDAVRVATTVRETLEHLL